MLKRLLIIMTLVMPALLGAIPARAEATVYILTDFWWPRSNRWLSINGTQFKNINTPDTCRVRQFMGFKTDLQRRTVQKITFPVPERTHFTLEHSKYLSELLLNIREGEVYYIFFDNQGIMNGHVEPVKLDHKKFSSFVKKGDEVTWLPDAVYTKLQPSKAKAKTSGTKSGTGTAKKSAKKSGKKSTTKSRKK